MSKPLITVPDFDAKISILYRCGLSLSQVGDNLGISRGMVSNALKRTGTPRRSKREALALKHDPLALPPSDDNENQIALLAMFQEAWGGRL